MTVARLPVRRFRMNMVFGMILLLFAVMLVRLGKLQLVDGAHYAAEADAKHRSAYRVAATRGRILDRGGVPLAVPKPARRLGIDVAEVRDPRRFAIALSDHLGGELQPWQIQEKLRAIHFDCREKDKPLPRYRVLLPYVDDPELVSRLDELKGLSIRRKRATGVWGAVVHRDEGREYPNGDYAAHVLGQMPGGPERPGTGIEEAFDAALRGEDREITLVRDARRRGYAKAGGSGGSTAGRDVRLTLDITIQHMLESAMDEMARDHAPRQAAGVVLDPHTGEILAMASRPTFDPNKRPANANLAIQGLYEPGSFFKPFTVACALGNDVVTADEILAMPPSKLFRHERTPIRDSHEVGPGTVVRLIGESSNTGAAELADRLGTERMRALFEALFPNREGGTRSGLPYEQRGGPREASWPWWRAHRVAYGQGIRVTPLQMATAFAAFARDDARMPQVRILADDPRPVAAGPVVCRLRDLETVRAGLLACTTEGTARRVFAGTPFPVAAKTATAEQRGTLDGVPVTFENCSVTAYAPADDPQVLVLILGQVPAARGVSGGRIAGPYVRQVLEGVLRYWRALPGTGAAVADPIGDAPVPAGAGGGLLMDVEGGAR